MCQCTFEADVNLDTVSLILMNLLTEVETVTSSSENLSLSPVLKPLSFPFIVRRFVSSGEQNPPPYKFILEQSV